MNKGKLYIIPTPLSGTDLNSTILPKDIEIVSNIKHFIVETPKIARSFLASITLSCPIQEIVMETYDEHSKPEFIQEIIQPLMTGEDMGLMTDAGTPCIADPGEEIVLMCQRVGIEVIPMIGPSSILLTLMGSGLNAEKFTFHGYLSRKTEQRKRELLDIVQMIRRNGSTQIFIEAPYRNQEIFNAILELPKELNLCLGINVGSENSKILTQPISIWKSEKHILDKVPTIFLIGR